MNRVKEKLRKNDFVQGVYLSIPCEELAEILGLSKYDFVVVDLEHGNIDFQKLPSLFRAIEVGGSLPFVRLASKTQDELKRVLDCGALGIHVPEVESKCEMENIISYTKYRNRGKRGASFSTRSGQYGIMDMSVQIKKADEDILIVATIETEGGVENLHEILSVKGIDVVNIALTDLSQSLGFDNQTDEQFLKIVDNVSKSIKVRNLVIGGTINTEENVKKQVKDGVKYFKIPSSNKVISDLFSSYYEMANEIFEKAEGRK